MRALQASDLLDLLDRGRGRGPAERALLLLARVWPEGGPEGWESLPLGHRDALVMALRAHTFGRQATLTAVCPGCGAELETDLDLAQVLAACPEEGSTPGGSGYRLEHAGKEVTFQLPTSADLLALAGADGGEALARRLVLAVDGAAPKTTEALPAGLAAALAEAVAQADPLVEVRVEIGCDACGGRSEQIFDIVSFFWAEIEAAARRVVREVHLLASAYGWSEAEILALGSGRRALYLEEVRP